MIELLVPSGALTASCRQDLVGYASEASCQ